MLLGSLFTFVFFVYTFSYRRPPKVALDDLRLKIVCGEHLGVLGPNGAGKSTAFNIMVSSVSVIALINSMYQPTSSVVSYDMVSVLVFTSCFAVGWGLGGDVTSHKW